MKNTTKKTAIILVAIFAIALVSGNALLAQDRNSGSLVTAADVAFIRGSTGTVTPAVPDTAASDGVISATDLAFVSQPFAETGGDRKSVDSEESAGVIAVADYRFVTGTSAADCDVFSNALACASN